MSFPLNQGKTLYKISKKVKTSLRYRKYHLAVKSRRIRDIDVLFLEQNIYSVHLKVRKNICHDREIFKYKVDLLEIKETERNYMGGRRS